MKCRPLSWTEWAFLQWLLVNLVGWLMPSPGYGQVTMQDEFSPFRADNVVKTWDAGVEYIFFDAVVAGDNENGDGVGYRSEEVVAAEDWLDALTAYANLPDPGDVDDILEQAGFQIDGGIIGTVGLDWSLIGDPYHEDYCSPGTQMTLSVCFARHAILNGAISAHVQRSCEGGSYSKWIDFRDAASEVVGSWIDTDNLISGCEFEDPTPTPMFMSPEQAANFLPTAEFSEEQPGEIGAGWPLVPSRLFDQRERSRIAEQLELFDDVAAFATMEYETTAYDGYPGFELYFGFFAFEGSPDAPEDEGDCPEGFCDGGSGGPGGGGDGVGEFCAENPDALMCLDAGEPEEVDLEELWIDEPIVDDSLDSYLDGLLFDAGDGVCPPPLVVPVPAAFGGGEFAFDLSTLCLLAINFFSPVLQLFAWFQAIKIISGAAR